MEASKCTGTISERRRCFEWRIEDFMRLLNERSDDERICSTGFEFARNQWYLEILPNVDFEDLERERWVEIRLFRKYCRTRDHVRAGLGIALDDLETEVCNRAKLLLEGETDWGTVPLVEKDFLFRHHHQLLLERTLVVFCYMSNEPIEEELSSDDEETLEKESCQLLFQHMLTMFVEDVDTDITIKVGNRKFRAHQAVLCARSPVFHSMLTNDMYEKNSGAVTIKDCEPSVFLEFLYYVYTGKVQMFTVDIAISLFIAADKYDCPDLSEQCVKYLDSNMTTAEVVELLKLATLLQNKKLHSSALRFFSDHMLEIFHAEAWMELIKENPVQANSIVESSLQSLAERNVFIIQ